MQYAINTAFFMWPSWQQCNMQWILQFSCDHLHSTAICYEYSIFHVSPQHCKMLRIQHRSCDHLNSIAACYEYCIFHVTVSTALQYVTNTEFFKWLSTALQYVKNSALFMGPSWQHCNMLWIQHFSCDHLHSTAICYEYCIVRVTISIAQLYVMNTAFFTWPSP
jgi:hypothetical protein